MTSIFPLEVPYLLNDEKLQQVPPISPRRALESTALSPTHIGVDEDDKTVIQAKSLVLPSHDSHYTNGDHLRTLEEGGCLFSFVCNHQLTPFETEMVNCVINLTAFQDEEQENYVPLYSHRLDESQEPGCEYTVLLARAAYLLAGVDIYKLLANPSLLASFEYQRSCQPEGTTVWQDYDKMERDNFRITKPIIPYLYNFTIQFRVSGILSSEILSKLARHIGTRVDGGILLERTKRSIPPKEDATKKCKSVLLYTDLGSSVFLVTHLTVILQRGLPEIVEKVIDTFGQWGLGETCDTAWRTRRYMKKAMPTSSIQQDGEIDNEEPGNSTSDDERFYDAGEDSGSDDFTDAK